MKLTPEKFTKKVLISKHEVIKVTYFKLMGLGLCENEVCHDNILYPIFFAPVIRIALNTRYGKHLTEGTENVLHTRYVCIYSYQ